MCESESPLKYVGDAPQMRNHLPPWPLLINATYATCFSLNLPADSLGSVSSLPGLSGVCLSTHSCVCLHTLEGFFLTQGVKQATTTSDRTRFTGEAVCACAGVCVCVLVYKGERFYATKNGWLHLDQFKRAAGKSAEQYR